MSCEMVSGEHLHINSGARGVTRISMHNAVRFLVGETIEKQ